MCDFCDELEAFDGDDFVESTLKEDEDQSIFLIKFGKDDVRIGTDSSRYFLMTVNINYCPICGKKLVSK